MYRLDLDDANGLMIPHTKAAAVRLCKAIGWRPRHCIKVDLGPLAGEGWLIADEGANGFRAPRHDQPAFRRFAADATELRPRLVRQGADVLHDIPFFRRVAECWEDKAYMPNKQITGN